MRNFYLLLLLFCCFPSCEKDILENENTGKNLPVIQAYLMAGHPIEISIQRQASLDLSDSSSIAIENLKPFIEAEGTTYSLTEISPGIYRGEAEWVVQSGIKYRLEVMYNDQLIQAETEIPSKPVDFESSESSLNFQTSGSPIPSFPDPIVLTWENPENDYYQVVIQNIEANPVELDFLGGGGEERPAFAAQPEQSNTYELRGASFQYVGTHIIVLFHVTSDYVTLAQESSNNDSQNLTTPFTNVENGLGIFTGIAADTVYLEVTE